MNLPHDHGFLSVLKLPYLLFDLHAVIQVHPDSVGGDHFYCMYKLPDRFLTPLGHVVIGLIQHCCSILQTIERLYIASELVGQFLPPGFQFRDFC